ncbi:transposase [Rhizobium laguerreae]|nr:transposase [Rhizobium laguerreae]
MIKPLLPDKHRRMPRVDHRRVLSGLLWVLRSGAPWRHVSSVMDPTPPAKIGSDAGRKPGFGAS